LLDENQRRRAAAVLSLVVAYFLMKDA